MFEYAPAPESRDIVDLKPSYGLFINGEFVDGSGPSFKTVNPATEETLAEVATASSDDVDRAVAFDDVADLNLCHVMASFWNSTADQF